MASALFSFLFLFCSATIASALPAEERYAIKSGMVEYAISGQETGSESLYFDDFGRKEARYSQVGLEKNKEVLDTAQFSDGEWVYQFDPKTNTALKFHWQAAIDPQSGQKRASTPPGFGEENLQILGGQKVGAKSILGYTCDIWEIPDSSTEICFYKSVPLEVVTTSGGGEKRAVAVSFRENSKVAAAKLDLPKDAKIEDKTAASELSAREWALKKKELELKEKELELQAEKSKPKATAKESNAHPLDQVDKATNATNRAKNSLRNFKNSVFGR